MSKELVTIYKCDRCGKQMDSQYAILTLKHAGCGINSDDLINKDLCADCFDKISKLVIDKKAMVVSTDSSGSTIKDSNIKEQILTAPIVNIPDIPMERATNIQGVDPLNRYLNVTCV